MKIASLITAAAVVASLSPARAGAQGLPRDPAERAKVIAQILEVNARQLTLFDRQGQSVGVVGPRDLYNQPVLSPDGKRLAVSKNDLDREATDMWVIDVATARSTQLTTSKMRESALFLDGPDVVVHPRFGDVITFRRSSEPLALLGIKSARR